MIIFNGDQLAAQWEQELKEKVQALQAQGIQPQIGAILFTEDSGSRLYTRLKREAALRVGIKYQVSEFSLRQSTDLVVRQILEFNHDLSVTGIIVQKPGRKTWVRVKGIVTDKSPKAIRQAFNAWWQVLTSKIDQAKDVDGLHPDTLAAIKLDTWRQQARVLPATAAAVLTILKQAFTQLNVSKDEQQQLQILVLGRSDIVGRPVFYELTNQGFPVRLLTRDEINQRLRSENKFRDADIIISATGVKHLITGEMVKSGAIIIDVGEPRPDVDLASMKNKATFITPVPGGVGPMTIVSLLQNCMNLI